jgi:hypothetical protein
LSFSKAVMETPHLAAAWQPGLGALRAQDKPHIQPHDPRALKGSVDIDGSLKHYHPTAHRWDFGIAYRHSNRPSEFVYWVEIHPATEKEVNVVLDKFKWLLNWLTSDGYRLKGFECDYVWLSSGKTSLSPTSPKLKQFAQLGLRYGGKILRIPNNRQQ